MIHSSFAAGARDCCVVAIQRIVWQVSGLLEKKKKNSRNDDFARNVDLASVATTTTMVRSFFFLSFCLYL